MATLGLIDDHFSFSTLRLVYPHQRTAENRENRGLRPRDPTGEALHGEGVGCQAWVFAYARTKTRLLIMFTIGRPSTAIVLVAPPRKLAYKSVRNRRVTRSPGRFPGPA